MNDQQASAVFIKKTYSVDMILKKNIAFLLLSTFLLAVLIPLSCLFAQKQKNKQKQAESIVLADIQYRLLVQPIVQNNSPTCRLDS